MSNVRQVTSTTVFVLTDDQRIALRKKAMKAMRDFKANGGIPDKGVHRTQEGTTMKLYHFTCPELLPSILESGCLQVVESNLSLRREHAGPDVVWLTDDPEPSSQRWGYSGTTIVPGLGTIQYPDKTAIRITVEVDDAHRYSEWRRQHGVRNAIYRALRDTGGDPERWWVCERPILKDEWVEVIDTTTQDGIKLRAIREAGLEPTNG
jgi:hypothetical protein